MGRDGLKQEPTPQNKKHTTELKISGANSIVPLLNVVQKVKLGVERRLAIEYG